MGIGHLLITASTRKLFIIVIILIHKHHRLCLECLLRWLQLDIHFIAGIVVLLELMRRHLLIGDHGQRLVPVKKEGMVIERSIENQNLHLLIFCKLDLVSKSQRKY